ncbi:MAG: single-stranded DNA-binding protein [Bifidobacteriaceae bacterium]|jgi:single-strand DNA-binding protein|nr:single-stranded DNA-binding protein [Bifidobacteriaceae bacterium]
MAFNNNEITVTVRGRAVADPERRYLPNGGELVRFRLAVTPRVMVNREKREWADGHTEWINVVCFQADLAVNVEDCVQKGHPLVVSGRLRSSEWKRQDGCTARDLEIIAETVAHDLRWGRTRFKRMEVRSVHPEDLALAAAPARAASDRAAVGEQSDPADGPGLVADLEAGLGAGLEAGLEEGLEEAPGEDVVGAVA